MISSYARLHTLASLVMTRLLFRGFTPKSPEGQVRLHPGLRLLAGSLLILCAASPAFAATDKVTTLADDGSAGTLRSVMAAASPGDRIVFGVKGTITLIQGNLEINKNLIISGPGAANLSVDGNGMFTVFQVDSGVAAVICGLTIQNGYANRTNGGGGINNQGALALIKTTVSNNIQNQDGADGEGIYNSGTLTLLHSAVSDNISSDNGAGIYNTGTLEIFCSTVTNNGGGLPGASGGGIYNASGGTITLVRSTVSVNVVHDGGEGAGIYNGGSLNAFNSTIFDNNDFSGQGAGIYNAGTLHLLKSTLSGNSSVGDFGGALANSGVAMVVKSTLSGNSASEGGWGGAIYNSAGTLTIVNSTLSGNSTSGGRGGAIYNGSGTLSMSFSTLSANSATEGGAVYNDGALTLKSTLLAAQSSGGNCFAGSTGSAASDGYNLSDDSTCAFLTQTGDQNNSGTAGLSPSGLQNNGGPTQTIALLPSSSAVNAIPVGACTEPAGNKVVADQRGVYRPQGPACDIGAYELATKK